jgi:hypothetical protein
MPPANSLSIMPDDEIMLAFVKEVDDFVDVLSLERDLIVHNRIDQFFYMEKAAEVRVLYGRIEEFRTRLNILQASIEVCYEVVRERLNADKAWLTQHHSEERR